MRFTPLHRIFVAIASIAMAFGIFSWAAPKNWDEEAVKRKAELLYFESQNAYGEGNIDDYVTIAAQAYALDPADLDIGAEWALIQLSDRNIDSVTASQAYQRVKKRFIADPSDYRSGMVLANIAKRRREYADLVQVWEMLDSANPSLTQPAEQLAEAYLISYIVGDSAAYDKALAIYDRLESGAGPNIGLSSQKIRAYAFKQDTTSIIREIDSLVAFAPKDPYVALFAGSNFQYLNDNENALKYYSIACDLDSTYGAAYMARAALYNEMDDSVAYDREVFHALHSQNLEVESKLEILHSYVSQLYTDRAQEPRIRQLFNALADMHPGEAEIYNMYAAYLFEIKDYPGAAEAMTYSVAVNPANEAAWTSLAQTLSLAKDYKSAIKYAKEATEKFPTNLYFPISAAMAYKELDSLDTGIALLDSFEIGEVANKPAVSNFISFKGDLLAAKGDTLAALVAYDEAIDLNPENLLALNNAAYFMAENGLDLDKAEKYSAKVVKLESENPTYLDTYAWIFFKKKEYSLARQYIDMTLNLYEPADTTAEIAEPDPDQVEEDYLEMMEEMDGADAEEELNHPTADVYEHAGDIYFMDGEPAKALEYWEKALALDPDNALLKKKVKHKTYFYK